MLSLAINTVSPLRHLDLRVRLLAILLSALVLQEAQGLFLGVMAVFFVAVFLISRLSWKDLSKLILAFLLFIALFILPITLINQEALGTFSNHCLVILRIFMVFWLGMMMSRTSTIGEIQTASAWFFLPLGKEISKTLGALVSLTLNAIPWILEEAKDTRDILLLRGLGGITKMGVFLRFFSRNILISLFSKAQILGQSLRLRGFEENYESPPWPLGALFWVQFCLTTVLFTGLFFFKWYLGETGSYLD